MRISDWSSDVCSSDLHNAMTLAFVTELFAGADYELQRLHGMGEGAHDAIVALSPPPRPVRVYAPVGTHRDLLAYLVRRLLENRSEEHTSELQSLMRTSYAVFCLKKKNTHIQQAH